MTIKLSMFITISAICHNITPEPRPPEYENVPASLMATKICLPLYKVCLIVKQGHIHSICREVHDIQRFVFIRTWYFNLTEFFYLG